MRISWGIKIIIVFAVFAAGIFTMVAVSMMSDTDLVSENYYEQEIKYQDQIDLLNKSGHLNESIIITQEGNNLILDVSDLAGDKDKKFEGKIIFYRSSDAGKDFETEYMPDGTGIQRINSENLEKGYWKVRLKLISNGEEYFVEKKIFIN